MASSAITIYNLENEHIMERARTIVMSATYFLFDIGDANLLIYSQSTSSLIINY
jgi:hypothetical protein